jgi:hypothetical protein
MTEITASLATLKVQQVLPNSLAPAVTLCSFKDGPTLNRQTGMGETSRTFQNHNASLYMKVSLQTSFY